MPKTNEHPQFVPASNPGGCCRPLWLGQPVVFRRRQAFRGIGAGLCCTTVVTGAVPSDVGEWAARTSMFPVLALKYDSTPLPSICLKLISPIKSPHNGVGTLFQPPSGPGGQPCQRDRSPKFPASATRYNIAGWLRSKLSATM